MTEPVPPSATSRPGVLIVTDPTLFSRGQEAWTELFARRVLRVPELRMVEIDPVHATAMLSYRKSSSDEARVVGRLADAAAYGEPLDESHLPPWRPGEPVVLYRHGGVVSTLEILSIGRRRLHARHPAIKREPVTARRIEEALRAVPGVLDVTLSTAAATLEVWFDPAIATGPTLLRVAETMLLAIPGPPEVLDAEHPSSSRSLVTLSVSAVGEFVTPVVLPAAAALLVWNNVGALRASTEQVREGKLGLPVLYSTIVVFTLLSGSFFSAALMFWFFRYWERRHLSEMADENAALLSEVQSVPTQTRVLTSDGTERLILSSEIEPGYHLRVLAGETIPVDATVVGGVALVDENVVGGVGGLVTLLPGDEVLAGRPVLAGRLDLAALRSGQQSRSAQLARALLATTIPASSTWTLTPEAEAFAARAVPPTLAAAAVGLFAGGPATANAVLRPDYATGIGLARSLRMLSLNRTALRHGALVRTRSALDHLAPGAWLVLDDYEGLIEYECELADFRIRGIPEEQLFPAIAAAGAWLGDARGPALIRACAARGRVARRARLGGIDEAGVAVNYGRHLVRLRGHGDRAALPPLRVEVDGVEVAALSFRRNRHLPAAVTVRQLQRAGLRVLVASGRPADEAACIARQIGADAYADLRDDYSKCSLLQMLHERGVGVLHVRDTAALPHTRDNYFSISLAGPEGIRHDADIVLLGRSIAPLAALVALSREGVANNRQDRWMVVGPNLAGVAGVFAFDITSLTVVLLSNLATYFAHDRVRRALVEAKTDSSIGADPLCFPDDVDAARCRPEAPEPEQMRIYA